MPSVSRQQLPASSQVNQQLERLDMSDSTLLDLPLELKIEICNLLPIGDLVKLRSVCKDTKALVDDPVNERAFVRTARKEACGVIQSVIKAVITYDANVDFLEALKAWVKHRGILIFMPGEERLDVGVGNTSTFAKRFKHNQQRDLNARWLSSLTKDLLLEWVARHTEILEEECAVYEIDLDEFLELHLRDARSNGYSKEWLVRVFTTLVTNGNFFQDVKSSSSSGRFHSSIHTLTSYRTKSRRTRLITAYGCISMRNLTKLLGVPSIPPNDFAYCVKTEWVYDLVKNGTNGLSELQKAAMLDELWVF
ncbi:hypothetical protein KC340_g15611 [Hortaea werneckii]|nr:hypothetical protein KC342_g15949 [Hortaea werneckii]KAI7062191.1 hypothetical protein KC339_g16628 [Hortaea werneckii]KAI7209087.1 hypothetical protein KC365_g15813 [Hortaea werneckii]KAI7295878.1 hypothetical protein KC340_g15611 [Hortaea werneckii]KAI7381617.1 hypothetical protein KC328_g12121 [Hortaea werneckii]